MPMQKRSITVTRSERVDFKRCPKKWYWRWRKGYTLKNQGYGALDLGTWFHAALAQHYTHTEPLIDCFNAVTAQVEANDRTDELIALGRDMATAYARKYANEPINVIAVEEATQFQFQCGKHMVTPDLLFSYLDNPKAVWLREHKTAKQIRTGHLEIDDQARGLATMAEVVFRREGLLTADQRIAGVEYNFIRKAYSDKREQNAKGQYLNKDGTVSKRQPTPVLVRHRVELSPRAKRISLQRINSEITRIATVTDALRTGEISPLDIDKTPHSSCEKLCDFFRPCVAEENGYDVREMFDLMYERRNPYDYVDKTTDIPASFELS
jgi:hypothetical protein